MRAAAIIGLLATALLLAGCGGDDAPDRSDAVEQLAGLCDKAREDIEALGLPAETGFEVLKPWSTRGKRLAGDVGRLKGATAEERTQLTALAEELAAYYDGLALGYETYKKTRSSEVYAASLERATVFLNSAEKRATAFGAPECAVRPFADYEPS